MKGDFSNLRFNPLENFTGVMHQQGRVLQDQDWNASGQIIRHQRQTLGRDAIGSHVAAVPAELRDSFKVTQATASGSTVEVTLEPGRVWLNGRMLQVNERPDPLEAQYLAPPIQTPQADPGSIASGVRDAVILEVWEESFNGFQDPLHLIEPALGGVDTTERVKLFHQLRLLRLGPDDECGNLADLLTDDFDAKGKLTVSPADTLAISGECPVEVGGGYTGFEHYLYRIEIADPEAGNARFKWSRFDGGLVGRGTYDSLASEITISANDQMINHCGLTSFYFEALQEGTDGGPWQITFRADATLSADGILSLTNATGTWPGTPDEAFFRLWDGIELISDYPSGSDTELENGIQLAFEAPAVDNSNYTSGDYWTFPVRAKGLDLELPPWPTDAPPQGIRKHRAPLAILNWNATPTVTITAPQDIFDCRHPFQPLAQLDSCCTYTVGDGMSSHGDFESIQEALNHLPAAGGEICVFPGIYPENIVIEDRRNITIKGCGKRSEIMTGPSATATDPVFHVAGSRNIKILNLRITATGDGPGILIEDFELDSRNVALRDLTLSAVTRSAIQVNACLGLTISDCLIAMADQSSPWPGIFLIAQDALVEHNTITVEGLRQTAAGVPGDLGVTAGRGGMQIGGTSERIRVIDNLIQGGIGNGITLGSLVEIDENGDIVDQVHGWVVNAYDPCDPCAPGSVYIPPGGGEGDGPTFESAGSMYAIRLERNRILDMGLNGIGVVAFFNLDGQDEFVSVEDLQILGNLISGCLQRPLEQVPEDMEKSMGYGGIALADVEYLVINDNIIENNGPDHLEPICGIFVLHGTGIAVSRNRIINNGAKTAESSESAKPGRRGGITIMFAVPPVENSIVSGNPYPRQNGVPAAKIHNNIVSQPLGQALLINALGPVSVLGNQFTSRGMIMDLSSPTFLAATVAILNLGLSNELYFQLSFGDPIDTVAAAGAEMSFSEEAVFVPRKGLDDQTAGALLANGNVLFNDNQCVLDLLETGFSFSISSILIFSLDDVSFSNNQCDSNLYDDLLLSQAIVIAMSCRVNDNRFKEGIAHALFSAITFGIFMNTTTDNQATHCILTLGVQLSFVGGFSINIVNSGAGIVNQQNITFWDLFRSWGLFEIDFCEMLSKLPFGRFFFPGQVGQTHEMINF